jgi:hypothetical protein
VSQVDPKENTRYRDWLSETYGVTVVVHQGAVHDYLEMVFNFSVKGKVMINMIKYIKKYNCQLPRGNHGHRDKPGHGPPFYSNGGILDKAAARRMKNCVNLQQTILN